MPPLSRHTSSAYYKASLTHDYQELTCLVCTREDLFDSLSRVTLQIEAAALGRIMTALDQNQPARSVELSTEEAAAVRPLYLLTMKPMVYAANVAEDDLADLGAANKHVQTMRKKAAGDSCELIIVSAQVRPQQAVWLPWQQKCCCCCKQGKGALLHLGGFLDQYLVQDSTCFCLSCLYHSKGLVDSMITAFCS